VTIVLVLFTNIPQKNSSLTIVWWWVGVATFRGMCPLIQVPLGMHILLLVLTCKYVMVAGKDLAQVLTREWVLSVIIAKICTWALT
jgi:hypothetical protein